MPNLHEKEIPRIKNYFSTKDKPIQLEQVCEELNLSKGNAYSLLDLMNAFGILDSFNRGKNKYYYLQEAFKEEQAQEKIPIPQKRIKTRKERPLKAKIKERKSVKDNIIDEYIAEMNIERLKYGTDTPLALALLNQPNTIQGTEPEKTLQPKITTEKLESLIRIREYGKVSNLPKEVRMISTSETKYIKALIEGINGHSRELRNCNTCYAKFEAIKNGRYGDTFYLSNGTNPWNVTYRVNIDPSISSQMLLPLQEAKRDAAWIGFTDSFTEPKIYYRGVYDNLLNKYLESGHPLVEVTVRNRTAYYVFNILRDKIKERGIENEVKISRVDNWVYLEKTR